MKVNIAERFRKLKQQILIYNPEADIELIEKAFKYSKKRLKEKKHIITQQPLIAQALEGLETLVKLKVDSETLVGALLYYNVIYGGLQLEDLGTEFNQRTIKLLDALKRFKEYEKKVSNETDEQKLLLAATKNPRVILIRLANRLGYLRKLDKLPKEKQIAYAQQCLNSRVPIAYKLGIHLIKAEMEDLALKYINPIAFKEIKNKIGRESQSKFIDDIRAKLEEECKTRKIPAKIITRPKHIFSIYKKMQRKQKGLEEIYDLTGLRVITDAKKRCYEILGLVHTLWKPIPEEFDDYIAKPKPNGYQSLHTTLIGPKNKTFEIQIRTQEMDRLAEHGVAAHWQYKGIRSVKKYDKKLSWLKQMMDWRKDLYKPDAFMDSLKEDFFEDEIFVFTPKKQVIALPQGSTVVDFAYAIHTQLGHACKQAKVNGKAVALDYELHSGETVEIIPSTTQEPKRSWLSFVKTAKAKNKIRGKLQIKAVKKLKKEKELKPDRSLAIKESNKNIKLAKCCLPIPGDNVIGYYTTKRKVIVHRKDCPNAIKQKNSKRLVAVHWQTKGKTKYLVEIRVEAVDRPEILTDVLQAISASKVGLKATHAKTAGKKRIVGLFTITTENQAELENLMDNLSQLEGVSLVERN